MNVHKIAAVAQMLSFVTGLYSAYGTYVALHPASTETAFLFSPTAVAISFGMFFACLLVVLIAHIMGSRTQVAPEVAARSMHGTDEAESEPEYFDQVRHAYRKLPMDQKITLAIIHRAGRISFVDLVNRLAEFDFAGGPQGPPNGLMNNDARFLEQSVMEDRWFIMPSKAKAVAEVLKREPPF